MPRKKATPEQKAQKDAMKLLAELGGNRTDDDDLVFKGRQLVLPTTMTPKTAISFLERHIEANEAETVFTRIFNYRINDGCHALNLAIQRIFGTSGIGTPIQTFFGEIPPELKEIATGVDTTAQVPSGQIEVPMIEGMVQTGGERHPEYGFLFKLAVKTKRKYRSHVEGLFKVVSEVLQEHSIYKGKAIDGQENPEFLDVASLDEDKIVFSNDVMTDLDANVWSLLEHTEAMTKQGLPLKRAVLLEGPYGTGKSSAGFITAKRALENGWTFILCRPGKDNLREVMQTARLYQPAVVFFEDIDTLAQSGDSDDVTRLLDMFDGISVKGTQLMALMTTNNVEKIHRGMLRPGRLDSVIHIGALDEEGIEKLVRSVVSTGLLADDVDWSAVAIANEGYLPAYVKEGVDRAIRYAITNNSDLIGTDELVASAQGLRRQWVLQQEAGEGTTPPTLDTAVREAVADVVHGVEFADQNGDPTNSYEADHLVARGTANGYGASRV